MIQYTFKQLFYHLDSEQLKNALAKYVPSGALDDCVDWIRQHRISVRIKHSRASRFGDYHPPQKGKGHKITINHDLNAYAFLITFTHEVAHLTCFLKHGNSVYPHGQEWKREFRYLLIPFIERKIFPDDLTAAVKKYISDPAASSCSDADLQKALKRYDKRMEGWTLLEDLPLSAPFKIRNGKQFVKGNRLRKNYECYDLHSRHKYFIHPAMEVMLI